VETSSHHRLQLRNVNDRIAHIMSAKQGLIEFGQQYASSTLSVPSSTSHAAGRTRPVPHLQDPVPPRSPAGASPLRTGRTFPGQTDRVLREADQILQGYIECFGSVRIPDPINWSIDIFTGHEWAPARRFAMSELCNVSTSEDVKVPYEISRCHHIVVLAKAYHVSKEEKYLAKAASHWGSWLRSIHTVILSTGPRQWMFPSAQSTGFLPWKRNLYERLPVDLRGSLTESLCQHGVHLADLESYEPRYSTNHYLSNLVGLIYLSTVLEDFAPARKWGRFCHEGVLR